MQVHNLYINCWIAFNVLYDAPNHQAWVSLSCIRFQPQGLEKFIIFKELSNSHLCNLFVILPRKFLCRSVSITFLLGLFTCKNEFPILFIADCIWDDTGAEEESSVFLDLIEIPSSSGFQWIDFKAVHLQILISIRSSSIFSYMLLPFMLPSLSLQVYHEKSSSNYHSRARWMQLWYMVT